ncbi:MAG TPA: DUF11 domain-containing protein [Thermoanaerobaculia bacterium]|nr:DUF11 domain-containing protein [Thermoanaerobaculia bacterium]
MSPYKRPVCRRAERQIQASPCHRLLAVLGLLCAGAAMLALPAPALAASCASVNASNFNGTPIQGGDTIWFNAVVAVKGIDPTQTTSVAFSSSSITFTAGGTAYDLAVPNSTITFSPAAAEASTTYDTVSNSWITTVPASYSGNVFLSGLAFSVPAAGLPGGANPVTWSGSFASATPGLKVQWQWAAAVYTQFGNDYNADGVKPINGDKLNPYPDSDHAGTPENERPFVTGGARGGGGSNYTGSYSGTVAVVPCPAPTLTMQKAFANPTVFYFSPSFFTVTVTNAGGQTAQNVEVSDLLDPSLQLVDANVTQGSGACTTSGQAVSCQFASLAPGETVQITVDFLAEPGPVCMANADCVVNNTATASDATGDTASASASVLLVPFQVE